MNTAHRAAALAGTVTQHFLFPTLIFSDYENRQSRIVSDTIVLPTERRLDSIPSLLKEWQSQAEWRFMEGNQLYKPFRNAGDGVDLGRLVVPQDWQIGAPTGMRVRKSTASQMEKAIKRVLPHLSTRSVLVIDMNWHRIDIHGYKRFFRSQKPFWNYVHYQLDLSGEDVLFRYFMSPDNFSLLSKVVPDDEYNNIVMNLFTLLPARIKQERLLDVVRAVYTNILLQVFKQYSLQDFGMYRPSVQDQAADFPLVVLTGEVPAIVDNFGVSMLMLLDGLQLSGMFYCHIDTDYRWRSLLTLNGRHFVLPLYTLFDDQVDLVLARSMQYKIDPSVKMEFRYKHGAQELTAQAGGIYRFQADKLRRILFKDKLLPAEIKAHDIHERFHAKKWRSLVVDVRSTPVRYGPTVEANAVQVPGWIDAFNRMYQVESV